MYLARGEGLVSLLHALGSHSLAMEVTARISTQRLTASPAPPPGPFSSLPGEEFWDKVGAVVNDAAGDISRPMEMRIEGLLRGTGDRRAVHSVIDVVSHALLLDASISPAFVVAASWINGGQVRHSRNGLVLQAEIVGYEDELQLLEAEIRFAPGMSWLGDGLRIDDPLPSTILSSGALPGRPLAEVVSHPVLDRHGLIVVGATAHHIDVGPTPLRRAIRDRRLESQIVVTPIDH